MTADLVAERHNKPSCGDNGGKPCQQEEASDGATASVSPDHRRTLVAADVGKVFTGTAYATPQTAWVRWIPEYKTCDKTFSPVITTCTCQKTCPKTCRGTNADGSSYSYDCSYSCPYNCPHISDWRGNQDSRYIEKWIEDPGESGEINKKAEIKVPYNYDIDIPDLIPCIELGTCEDRAITYPGEDKLFEHNIIVGAMSDDHGVRGGTDYATNSRPSTYEIVSFIVTPDVSKESMKHAGTGTQRYGVSGPTTPGESCTRYYTSGLSSSQIARGCVVVQRQENIYFNVTSGNDTASVDLDGKTDGQACNVYGKDCVSLSPSIVVDDLPAGSKICVALSVWPSSHRGLNEGLQDGFTGGYWEHGDPECLTIAKKPTTQFWGAGLYSAGTVTTSQANKYAVGSGFRAANCNGNPSRVATEDTNGDGVRDVVKCPNGGNNGLSENVVQRSVFGTWSEYEIISGKSVTNMGSGAAFGYNPYPATWGGNYEWTRPGGFPSTYNINFATSRTCAYTTQTFPNLECKTGGATQPASNIATNTELNVGRIIARYGTYPKADAPVFTSIGSDADCAANNCDASADGATHSYSSGARSVTIGDGSHITIPVGRTVAVTVTGKLTINSNIVYEEPAGGFSNISSLPQVILIADSIDVAPHVSQIDAWLIVGQQGDSTNTDSGILNTCRGFTVGAAGSEGRLNACNDQPLTVNGPVFAEQLKLNRTYGASAGVDSIDPAERFNLRADAFLWSYAQAQRFSQAVVTYTRELAPRY